MNYPSIKSLQRINGVDAAKAKAIRRVLQVGRTEALAYPTVAAYESQCYNRPESYVLKMMAINVIIEGYGVEAIDIPSGSFSNCQTPDICIEYINLGETYETTLCRVNRYGHIAYRVIDWGTLVERYDKAAA